jgi:hypothetical protein
MSGLFDVSKETILITGASQGLGRQFARVLSAQGAAVVLAARQTAKLKSLEEEIKAKGGRAAAVQMDVTDTASIGQAVDSAEAAFGPISVLINNAGIAIEKLATEQTEADWDAVINANLKGAYFLATEMARRMIARQQQGNIVNIASVLSLSVMKFLSPYTISKAGIIRATKKCGSFAFELIRQAFFKTPLLLKRVTWNSKGITMRFLACLGFLLAATAANAQTYTTVVNRDAKTVTTTGPTATVTTTQTARTGSTATYTTTVNRTGGGYQPMGAGGYNLMGK